MDGMGHCRTSGCVRNPTFDVFCLCVAGMASLRSPRPTLKLSRFAAGWLLNLSS